MRQSIRAVVVLAVAGSSLSVSSASGQDCSTAVNTALADGSLAVESITPDGVRIRLEGDLAHERDPEKLRALLANIDCALAGPGGRLKKLELVLTGQRVVARESGGTVELPVQTPPP